MTNTAFRLAFESDTGLRTSRYGYVCPEAAEVAAPLLNLVRFARLQVAYTHIVVFQGERAVEVRTLEERAA